MSDRLTAAEREWRNEGAALHGDPLRNLGLALMVIDRLAALPLHCPDCNEGKHVGWGGDEKWVPCPGIGKDS